MKAFRSQIRFVCYHNTDLNKEYAKLKPELTSREKNEKDPRKLRLCVWTTVTIENVCFHGSSTKNDHRDDRPKRHRSGREKLVQHLICGVAENSDQRHGFLKS